MFQTFAATVTRMTSGQDERAHSVALTKAGIAWITALAGGASGSLALIAGFGALASEFAPIALSEWCAKGGRIDMMGEAAVDEAGSVERLLAEVDLNDESRSLFVGAVEAAASTEYPPALRGIGRALANGVIDDGAKLDSERQYVEALAQVRRPHIVVMWALRKESGLSQGDGGLSWLPKVLSRRELRDTLPASYRPSLDRLLATLQREGLIDRESSSPEKSEEETLPERPMVRDSPSVYWALSTFGLSALARLYNEGAREDLQTIE